jgi:enolase-phosphatase E1
VKYILMDVEGTTTSIRFVSDVLFPYSIENLDAFLAERKDLAEQAGGAAVLKRWIREDRKEPLLKRIQGLIWQKGYESGDLKGHVYSDVPAAFERWNKLGLRLGIYSSGSVLAQRLLFGHSTFGDLNPFLADNFDTEMGPKRETSSYERIALALGLSAREILFLSDVGEELAAARRAGYLVLQIVREGTAPALDFEGKESFTAIKGI